MNLFSQSKKLITDRREGEERKKGEVELLSIFIAVLELGNVSKIN